MYLRWGPAARQRAKRFLWGGGVVSFVLVLVVGVPSWILFPPHKALKDSDVVMVVAGASDGRHELAARLVEGGTAKNFVVSNPGGRKEKVGSSHCRGVDMPDAADKTWCLSPKPRTTIGEALTIGKLAEEQGWSTATVVTSRTHARRVHTMFKYCSGLDANVVFVDDLQTGRVKKRVIHEIGGYIKFWLTKPC